MFNAQKVSYFTLDTQWQSYNSLMKKDAVCGD